MNDLVVEILEKAAALIQDGWCRGIFSHEICRLTKNGPVQHTCYCAEGAIVQSLRVINCSLGHSVTDVARSSANEARRLLITRIVGQFGNKYSAALLGTKNYYSIIASFNDDESVSREEVLAVFRDAITMAYRNSSEVPQLLLTHEVTA